LEESMSEDSGERHGPRVVDPEELAQWLVHKRCALHGREWCAPCSHPTQDCERYASIIRAYLAAQPYTAPAMPSVVLRNLVARIEDLKRENQPDPYNEAIDNAVTAVVEYFADKANDWGKNAWPDLKGRA